MAEEQTETPDPDETPETNSVDPPPDGEPTPTDNGNPPPPPITPRQPPIVTGPGDDT